MYFQIWEAYQKSVGGGGDAIPQDKFVNGMKSLVESSGSGDTLTAPLPLFFHAVDRSVIVRGLSQDIGQGGGNPLASWDIIWSCLRNLMLSFQSPL